MDQKNNELIETLKSITKENEQENLNKVEKNCSYCFEKIHTNAIKCKHCGSDLTSKDRKNFNKYSGLAITSFVFGVLSVFFGSIGIIPLIALIIGIISLFKLRQMKRGNKIFAIIGFILALIYSINFFLVFSSIGPNILNIGYEKNVKTGKIDKNTITNIQKMLEDNNAVIQNQQPVQPPPTTPATVINHEDDIKNLMDEYTAEMAKSAKEAWEAGQARIERAKSLNEE